jgi:hypothetical protein
MPGMAVDTLSRGITSNPISVYTGGSIPMGRAIKIPGKSRIVVKDTEQQKAAKKDRTFNRLHLYSLLLLLIMALLTGIAKVSAIL